VAKRRNKEQIMPERCVCGATDCKICGPLQGYKLPAIIVDEIEAELATSQEVEEAFDRFSHQMYQELNKQIALAINSGDSAALGKQLVEQFEKEIMKRRYSAARD
jgi:hypothetical protein